MHAASRLAVSGDSHFRVGLGRADCKALFERWELVANATEAASTDAEPGCSELARAAEAYVRAMEGRLEGGSSEDGRPVGY